MSNNKIQKPLTADGKFHKYSIRSRITKIVICLVVLMMLVAHGALTLGLRLGSFTVYLERESMHGGKITLSDSESFEFPRDTLYCDTIPSMTNICGKTIPENVADIDGSHNGAEYMAFTFYLKNTGDEDCSLVEHMEISSHIKDVPSAIRVSVFRNGERTDYAKFAADGSLEKEFCDVGWSDNVIFHNDVKYFDVGDTLKYVVVIWIEGDDPECLDSIRGGNVKLSMKFTVSG